MSAVARRAPAGSSNALAPARAQAQGTYDASEGKLAAQVARRIGDEIVAQGWPVGRVMGSEAQLMQQFGVSRAVLREAVRLVEHHTVATMRRGPAGGLVVRKPDPMVAVNALVVYLEYTGVGVDHIMDARVILEPLAATWAAESITEEGIEHLRATVQAEHDQSSAEASNPNQDLVHKALAKLSGNPTLDLFIDVLAQLTLRYARTSKVSTQEEQRVAEGVFHAHDLITEAVIAGRPGVAQHRTEEHLKAMSAWLTSKYGGASTARQAQLRARARVNPPRQPGAKLAEHVANQIRDELMRRDWPIGEVIGSEAALLEKYNVSRAVLREAVRLLEHHSIAKMRRGPGGGLIGTKPDPSASVEAMALLLDYDNVTVDQVRAVRDAIELACVVRVANRVHEPGVTEQLAATAKMDSSLMPGAEINDASENFHTELAQLSGNPLLSIFVQILTRLWGRHVGDVPAERAPMSTPEINASVQRAHELIVDAIQQGDPSLARHRMQRHLTALTEWWH